MLISKQTVRVYTWSNWWQPGYYKEITAKAHCKTQ